MSDLERYVKKRKRLDPEFAEGFDVGYSNFKVGVLLRQAREKAGMTQDDVARRLRTKKSAISRIENHAEDIRLSTIQKYAKALGKNLRVEIRGCHTIEGQACNMQFQGRCELHIACLTPRPKVSHDRESGMQYAIPRKLRITHRMPDPRPKTQGVSCLPQTVLYSLGERFIRSATRPSDRRGRLDAPVQNRRPTQQRPAARELL